MGEQTGIINKRWNFPMEESVMNPRSHSSKLAVTMLLSGICALALRKGLYATAVDVTGLHQRNQPLSIALT